MSRYTVTVFTPGCFDDNAIIGYDPPLRTFFIQAFPDPETDEPAIWLGTRLEQFPALPPMLELLEKHGCRVEGLDADIVAEMADEAAQRSQPSLAERLGWPLR